MDTVALEPALRRAVGKNVPPEHFDDALQEAWVAILSADEGHTPPWYIQKGVWAARDYVRREVVAGRIRCEVNKTNADPSRYALATRVWNALTEREQ